MLLNCGVGEDSWDSLGQQGDPVNPKGNQSWIFIGRPDSEAETPILWPPDAKSWLIWKNPDAGKDWRQEKGMTEDEMVGWHHQLYGHEFEQAPRVGDGRGGLAYCGSWGRKELDGTELNWTLLCSCFLKERRCLQSTIISLLFLRLKIENAQSWRGSHSALGFCRGTPGPMKGGKQIVRKTQEGLKPSATSPAWVPFSSDLHIECLEFYWKKKTLYA